MSSAPERPLAALDDTYDHRAVEEKWRLRWAASRAGAPDLDAAERPFYNLMMFPYPSAEGLHVGNVYAFTGADIHGRYRRFRGDDVFEPIGFDAFGIHTENYAIKVGEHPARLTPRSVAHFSEQLHRLGAMFDWAHTVDTTDPAYYRWTQWLFVRLFKAGLAEHREGPVNWCPSCLTVLADEQVIEGRCERCESVVEHRVLKQWWLRITRYAQALLDALDELDWSEPVVAAQRSWIGRSQGATIRYDLTGCPEPAVTVFTTRADTLYGATFLAVSADHLRLRELTAPERWAEVEAWQRALPPADLEPDYSIGVDLGTRALHPLTGAPLPVFAAPYILGGYGTGVVHAVPAHDERDHAFARAHGLPIVEVVSGGADVQLDAFTGQGTMVNSAEFDGISSEEMLGRVVERLAAIGRGGASVQYRLRDWLISRQRYWGPPIPIVHCPEEGPVPVPEEQLPVLLPEVEDFKPIGTGRSPLAAAQAWVEVACPQCGRPARRETDVSDTFLDSAWYFLRYPSTDFDDRPFDRERTWRWLPVSTYIGGREHSVLHLLYSRFVMRALFDLGLVPDPEPFARFRAHGMIVKSGAKMSKSRGNVVNPDTYLDRHGADTLRLFLVSIGPFSEGGDWQDDAIRGQRRFLDRLWRCVQTASRQPGPADDAARERRRHRLISTVARRTEELRYNTAVAALHEFSRELDAEAQRGIARRVDAETLLQLLAPYAPHIAEELWERTGHTGSIHDTRWPQADAALAAAEEVVVPVTVDGRRRDQFTVAAGTPEAELARRALELPRIAELLHGSPPRKVVAVVDRIVNIVTSR